jgi:hypothetical protein
MSISINPFSSSNVQSILTSAVQDAGSTTNKATNIDTDALTAVAQRPDDTRLSPFAKMMITLRHLQQSDPTKYQQVTQQIATNLQRAAQTAQSNGHTTAATQLNQLAAEFTSASQSGQLPNIQDLAQAVGISHPFLLHRYRHHHPDGDSAGSDAASSAGGSSSSASGSSASQTPSQLLEAFQTNGTQSDALNPMNIVLSTLSNAGIAGSNG